MCRTNKGFIKGAMNTKEWDEDIEKSLTSLELIEEYWNERRKAVYKEVKEEVKKEFEKND